MEVGKHPVYIYNNDPVLTALLSQYEGARSEIIALMGQNERIMQIGVVIAGGAFSFGILEGIEYLLMFIPFGVITLCLVALSRYELVHALGGYKRYLEEQINRRLGEKIAAWEQICHDNVHHSFSDFLIKIIIGLFLVGSSGVSILVAHNVLMSISIVVFVSYVLVLSGFSLGLIVSFVKFRKMFDRMYSTSSSKCQLVGKIGAEFSSGVNQGM